MWIQDKFLNWQENTYHCPQIEKGVYCVVFRTDNQQMAKDLMVDAVNYWLEQTDGYDDESLTFFPKIQKKGKWWHIYTTMVDVEKTEN